MERILLIEDDQALGRGTALALAGEGREIRVAATLAQGWAALGEGVFFRIINRCPASAPEVHCTR